MENKNINTAQNFVHYIWAVNSMLTAQALKGHLVTLSRHNTDSRIHYTGNIISDFLNPHPWKNAENSKEMLKNYFNAVFFLIRRFWNYFYD